MKVLITGGAGFVGANLAFYLKDKGYEVYVLDNLVRRGSEFNLPLFKQRGIKFIHGDVRNVEDFESIPKNMDFICECSAQPAATTGYDNPYFDFANNTIGLLNVLEFARKNDNAVIFWSLDSNEDVFVRKDKQIQKTKIGKIIDSYFKKEEEGSKSINGLETLSLNLKTLKMEWKNIKSLIRHKINTKLIELTLESGRKIRVTEGHSIFVVNKNGNIITKSTKDITQEDYVLIPTFFPAVKNLIKKINLASKILKSSKNCESFSFRKIPNSFFTKALLKKSISEFKSNAFFYAWKKNNAISVKTIKRLGISKISEKVFVGCQYFSKHNIFSQILINKELMRILGFYVAEGYIVTNKVGFTFGISEKELRYVKELCYCIKKVFNYEPHVYKYSYKNSIEVIISNKVISFFFREVLKIYTKDAHTKHIPDIIWNVSKKMQFEFLRALLDGDGNKRSFLAMCYNTCSEQLVSDFQYLMTGLGKIANSYFVKYAQQSLAFTKTSSKGYYQIVFSPSSRFTFLPASLVKKETGISIQEQRISRAKLKKILNSSRLIEAEIAFVKVKEKRYVKSSSRFVYDFAIDKNENFVGGSGGIICHNSTNKVYSGEKINALHIIEKETRYEWLRDKDNYTYHIQGFDPDYGISQDFTVDGGQHSIYGLSKIMSDLACQEYYDAFKVKTVVNRFSCLAGEGQFGKCAQGWVAWWAVAAHFNLPVRYIGWKGKQVRDVLFIEDICRLVELEMEKINVVEGEVFTIGGGMNNTLSLREATKIIEDKYGKKLITEMVETPRKADHCVYISDIRRIQNVLNWKPKIGISEGYDRIIKWVKKNEQQLKSLYL